VTVLNTFIFRKLLVSFALNKNLHFTGHRLFGRILCVKASLDVNTYREQNALLTLFGFKAAVRFLLSLCEHILPRVYISELK
jgi:hypothetical protein